MFDKFKLFEFLLQECDELLATVFNVSPRQHFWNVELARLLQDAVQVAAKTVFADLVEQVRVARGLQQRHEVFLSHVLGCELRLRLYSLQLFISHLPNFDFNLEAHTVLVFDVLGRTEAFELSMDHDADLGAQRFSFFH